MLRWSDTAGAIKMSAITYYVIHYVDICGNSTLSPFSFRVRADRSAHYVLKHVVINANESGFCKNTAREVTAAIVVNKEKSRKSVCAKNNRFVNGRAIRQGLVKYDLANSAVSTDRSYSGYRSRAKAFKRCKQRHLKSIADKGIIGSLSMRDTVGELVFDNNAATVFFSSSMMTFTT